MLLSGFPSKARLAVAEHYSSLCTYLVVSVCVCVTRIGFCMWLCGCFPMF